jgi:hypothetical protein
MELPHCYEEDDMICSLLKALYGLKQSPRSWQKKLHAELLKLGFTPIEADHCIYVTKDGLRGIIIVTYVDDFLLVGPDKVKIQQFKEVLSSIFEMKDLGDAARFLGVRITRDRSCRTITLVQDQYIKKIGATFNLLNSRPVSTPMESSLLGSLDVYKGQATAAEIQRYQQGVGSLNYASTQTRPDLALTVSVLSRYLHNPSPEHWSACQHAIRYLVHTKNLGIKFQGSDTQDTLDIHGWCDSDYAADKPTRRSTTGYVFFVAGGPVSWKAMLQKCVTLSSTEAEYYAITHAAREAVWLRRLLLELGYTGDELEPMEINSDNLSSHALAKNPNSMHQRAKHIDVQWHFAKEQVESGSIEINWVPGTDNTADGFTKPLNMAKHKEFVRMLGMTMAIEFSDIQIKDDEEDD